MKGDPRTRVHLGDVAERLRGAFDAWDALALDVDNGPADLTAEVNDWLDSDAGLATEEQVVRAHGNTAARHVIWLGWRTG